MNTKSRLIYIPADGDEIQADLRIPEDSKAIVIFAHGSGSSRHSPRNQYVAGVLNDGRIATLLIDLPTPDEEVVDLENFAAPIRHRFAGRTAVGRCELAAWPIGNRKIRYRLFRLQYRRSGGP